MLIKGLPHEAALFRSMPEHGGWTVTDHLLALVVDSLGITAYNALLGPHADPKKLRRVKPPERLPRPGARPQRRRASSDDLKRMFGAGASYRPREVS